MGKVAVSPFQPSLSLAIALANADCQRVRQILSNISMRYGHLRTSIPVEIPIFIQIPSRAIHHAIQCLEEHHVEVSVIVQKQYIAEDEEEDELYVSFIVGPENLRALLERIKEATFIDFTAKTGSFENIDMILGSGAEENVAKGMTIKYVSAEFSGELHYENVRLHVRSPIQLPDNIDSINGLEAFVEELRRKYGKVIINVEVQGVKQWQ